MTNESINLKEFTELEEVRLKEIKGIIKQGCKLFKNLIKNEENKFLSLKYEAYEEDLRNINNILEELKRLRSKISNVQAMST